MKPRTIALSCLLFYALGGLSIVGFILARRAIYRPAAPPRVVFSPPPPLPLGSGRAVVVGNSLTVGPFVAEMSRYLAPGWQVAGRGISGQTTERMIADGDEVDRLRVPGAVNVLVVWEGTNDLFFGASVDQAFSRLRSYCEARRKAGWSVVVLTLLPRLEPGTPGGFETSRTEVNRRLRATWPGCPDSVVDVAADLLLANPADRSTFRDGTHLTPLGTSIAACRAAAAVLSITEASRR
jgi:hypothetical protein